MCLFPKKVPINSVAWKYGIEEFSCGVCPECLKKKASQWALRATYHAKDCDSMMICLTYDSYIRNSRGLIVGERVASDMKVNKRDCQLFIKRLRKAYPNNNLKYIISAEIGKKTKRPHYHCLIFGLRFDDIIPYKKSKRGNLIYKSNTLERIWGNGICTVDAVNIRSAMARYCTKYAMKDRQVDTFMLFSRDIGTKNLMKDFNGISYWIDGREYPIPKLIWRDYLCKKYSLPLPRYRSFGWCMSKYGDLVRYHIPILFYDNLGALRLCERVNVNYGEKLYDWFALGRERYSTLRDSDDEYKAYLRYWQIKAECNPFNKLSAFERLMLLDDSKYHSYKQASLKALHIRSLGLPVQIPRSDSLSELYKLREAGLPRIRRFDNNPYRDILRANPALRVKYYELTSHLPLDSCLLTANDTTLYQDKAFFDFLSYDLDTGEVYDSTILSNFKDNTYF